MIKDALGKFLNKKTGDYISVNLGSYYIKGLVISEGVIQDYVIKKQDKDLGAVIKTIWQEKNFSQKKVRISLKNRSSLVRCFSFPKMEKKKLREALFYELNKYIPFSPDEVYFDFAILEEINPQEVFVLLAVVKKELIDKILAVFDQQNLKIQEISIDSICLANLFPHVYPEEKNLACVLDIGYSFSSLMILKRGSPSFIRDLEFGARNVFEVISHVKNLPPADIEAWFFSLEDHRELLNLAQNSISNLCKEVKSSFDYFEVNKGERIEKMYFTGGLASTAGLRDIFEEALDVEANPLDALRNSKVNFSDEKFDLYKISFAAALGLVI